MIKSKNTIFSAVVCLLTLLTACHSKQTYQVAIIPVPESIQQHDGVFMLTAKSKVSINDPQLAFSAQSVLKNLAASDTLPVSGSADVNLRLVTDTAMADEAYRLTSAHSQVTIEARTPKGVFYGVQTLLQLIDENKDSVRSVSQIPYLEIKDAPRFAYRGMHLDVSRNFHSVQEVKRYIDLLAMYKYNNFQWHLVDGAGWRMQLKKYPLLTQKTAFRYQKTWKEYWKTDRKFATEGETNVYGGYYTQEQMKEVVAYAAQRYVNVIPEIEMPSHSEEVFVAYPDLCCAKKPYKGSDFCAGNEKVFQFLSDVLDEVISIFPSPYIHIGGDEAGKAAWKTCPLCQRRMRQEHLKNVNELQSYFMKRMVKMVESKGRKAIGWDEILEGGIAPNVTIMSWRGEKGGIDAARMGHDVIMTPGQYCYFDAYQADPKTQPEAIGGYLPLHRVYNYEPYPKDLAPQYRQYLKGIQACLWTEYIPTDAYLEEMVLPRMIALSEVAWSRPQNHDWSDFKRRLAFRLARLGAMGYYYHHPDFQIIPVTRVDTLKKQLVVRFDTEQFKPEIHYTLDGTNPTIASSLFKDSLLLSGYNHVKAAIFKNGQICAPVMDDSLNYHLAIGKKVKYNQPWNSGYPAGGDSALVDGYHGALGYSDGRWQGFTNDMDVTIDLGKVTAVKGYSAKFMQLIGPGVYLPSYVQVSLSVDGKHFTKMNKLTHSVPLDQTGLIFKTFSSRFNVQQARYVRMFAKNPKGFIFTDEIEVY